ncbi:unnamed protein product [Dicrocoelium dendriticum]|nr:unnamed protein product [Dicrocoelium dendriticum]
MAHFIKIQKLIARNSTAVGLILYIIGLLWFCLLSQEELNHGTYLSENALLVGQVAEEFSDNSLIQRYEKELQHVFAKNDLSVLHGWLKSELMRIGLEVYDQNFTFSHDLLYPLEHVTGTNLYAIMRSPSAGRTEALLITVPLRTECSDTTIPCLSASLSLLLSLMGLFRRQIYWAKDIVIVFPDSDYVGLTAWLEAYHGSDSSEYLSWSELQGRSGAIQAGLNLEFSHFDAGSVDILSEGKNGLLANLDLVNTVVRLAHKLNIEPVVNGQVYTNIRDFTMLRWQDALGLLHAVWTQSSGSPTGLHGLPIGYQIPAVTIRGPSRAHHSAAHMKNGAHLGKLIEGILRSLNNLQERMHQSFWYYLLPNPMRYVSIGVYMPPVLILIGSLLLKVISFWWIPDSEPNPAEPKQETDQLSESGISTTNPDPDQLVRKRKHSPERNHSTDSPSAPDSPTLPQPQLVKYAADEIPPILSHLAIWIVVSFASGLCLHGSPDLIFTVYKHPEWQSIQHWLGIQPWTSDFLAAGILLLFVALALLAPILSAFLQWCCFVSPIQSNSAWSTSILLVTWTLFLACAACLNVSASLFLSVVVVPLLLLFVHGSRNSKARIFAEKFFGVYFGIA